MCFYGATLSPSYKTCESQNKYYISASKYSGLYDRTAVLVVCESVVANTNGSAIAALATIALVISTIGLWVVTGTAAHAAKDAAEALPISERAYVYPEIIPSADIVQYLRATARRAALYDEGHFNTLSPEVTGVAFKITNLGKTPAIIRRLFAGFYIRGQELEGEITHPIAILGAGKSAENINVSLKVGMSANQATWVIQDRDALCLSGTIYFDDIWGNKLSTSFLFTWESGTNRMILRSINTKKEK